MACFRIAFVPLVAVTLGLAACSAGQPVDFVDNSAVDLDSPGLFSGRDGTRNVTFLNGSGRVLNPQQDTTSVTQPVPQTSTAQTSQPRTTEERILLPDGRVMVRRVTVEEKIVSR
ncbi:hypothetical protein [Litoreibacter roseus]|uniref:Beta-barrel assembly machine subunit BamF n=1 Tax=Litoreibacter roseus TaxID=2601869 RepID=A0A6N6JK93_9RHOB|nr:hypothetical protein [Litoreibacter roseus]GFE65849.1 hypothetical protein KIN_29230 [Litoreibacter roseus]